jgi:hypothetical protein
MIEPEITTERVGIVAWRLAIGVRMSTAEAAELMGITRTGAWYTLMKLARVLPIDIVNGCWQCINADMLESGHDVETAQRN